MVNQIFPVLKQWQETKALVIVKAAGEEAFCGGNDARGLVEAELRGESYAKKFYHVGLSLNALIANYKIPYVVLMDGLVSGDGAGLTVHAEYSVCTERTVFSMPHCSFGFFPDMGATYFLPRLQGELGKYLGLTGHEIAGRDVQRINLATHYCDSNRIKDLERELERCDTHEEVISVLRKHESKDLDHFSLVPILEQIDHCFSGNTIEEIMKRLSEDPSTWAQESLKEMKYNSPMSLKVTLEALKRGRKMSLRDCLNMEYNMAQMAISHKDLYEGVRANIIDKDRNPSWRPATLEEVTDEHVLAFFPKMRIKSII
ncbi:3-hydroxyisobutyryl-CoA hydrolase, mitochondrial-like [Chrysoperla carnea]|uniref:3-hydroxyisobutyryl-CoA hydrolase, mitochondrial-like n=1 Tax=Chrysoperla carnea TaxID=189513 RepID=UPI001D05F508|nr:3-hydroxyisobutyryl-CoA hydrolase, mitochondrial-like [Chrysoperla carnea]